MYAEGSGGLPQDDAQAVVWRQKAAEQGKEEQKKEKAKRDAGMGFDFMTY